MKRHPSNVPSPSFTPQTPDFEFPNQSSEKNEFSFAVYVREDETELSAESFGLPHSQANQRQPNQVEIYEGQHQTKPEVGRAKLSPAQKRENKRQTDQKYRKKQRVQLELQRLTDENIFLRAKVDRLTDEKSKSKSYIASLHPNQQFPVQDPKELEIYISRPPSQQHDNKSLPVQDHHGTNSGAADNLSSFKGNGSDLQNLHQQIPITAVAIDRQARYDQLMQKLEADDDSNVCFSDFKALDGVGELVKVGKYSFPLPLHPVVKKINDVYGDVSATSKVNLHIAEVTYILFCASVKEMDELKLEQVTEDRILKWRDAIKDALRIHFKVDFAMEHLKKIASAYIGRIESRELESISESISKLEADLNSRRQELAKRKVLCKKSMDAAMEFDGKSLSLFP